MNFLFCCLRIFAFVCKDGSLAHVFFHILSYTIFFYVFRAWTQHRPGVRHDPAQRVGLDPGGRLHASPVQRPGVFHHPLEVGVAGLLQEALGSASEDQEACQAEQCGRVRGDGDPYLKAVAGQWVRTAESTVLYRSGVNFKISAYFSWPDLIHLPAVSSVLLSIYVSKQVIGTYFLYCEFLKSLPLYPTEILRIKVP